MNYKKTSEASLENKKLTFLLMGFVFVLSLCFVVLEWTDTFKRAEPIPDAWVNVPDEADAPITGLTPPPPPPAPVTSIKDIVVVPDTKDVESTVPVEDESKDVVIAPPPAIEDDPIEEPDDVIFRVVEELPQFPGGEAALFQYLSKNVHYPVMCQENDIQGRVVCEFTVNKDGSITDVVVIRSAGNAALDREAVRVVQSMPNWVPGKQRGKPVRVTYYVPINFRLTQR